jgi:hypothetical protein
MRCTVTTFKVRLEVCDSRQANRRMGQVQGQPGAGVCHRRLYSRQSV